MMNKIEVFANNKKVGTLAFTKDKHVAFQYDKVWIEQGFSINPFKLPLTDQVFVSTSTYFKGLFGVFADSLPDSYVSGRTCGHRSAATTDSRRTVRR